MKKTDKSTGRSFEELIAKLSTDDILDLNRMLSVRGGDGDGEEPIIIVPKPK